MQEKSNRNPISSRDAIQGLHSDDTLHHNTLRPHCQAKSLHIRKIVVASGVFTGHPLSDGDSRLHDK